MKPKVSFIKITMTGIQKTNSCLTFPLFFGAMRKVRILSTRSEWVPFFSRSKTPQTTFSLVLVKFEFLHEKNKTKKKHDFITVFFPPLRTMTSHDQRDKVSLSKTYFRSFSRFFVYCSLSASKGKPLNSRKFFFIVAI